MTKTPITAALAGLALIATLTGCTASAPSTADTTAPSTGTPKATPTATATPAIELPADINACVDGRALINTTKKTVSFPTGCDTVFIQTENATIDLGPTKKVVFEGHGNTVTYTGTAPEAVEAGESAGTNHLVAR